jgi:aminopeptidase
MPNSSKIQKIAQIIINYSVDLQKNEKILLVGYGFESYPLIKELYREAVKKGAKKVETHFPLGELKKIFLENATNEQINYIDPIDKKIYKNFDCFVQIVAEDNPYELSQIPAEKISLATKARKRISDIMINKKWCLFYYPNQSSAQTAKKPLDKWQEFVFNATIQDWKKEEIRQKKFIDILKKVSEIQIKSEETDLKFSVKKQNWQSCCGLRNLPDGEVFTAPIKKSVNGVIKYNIESRYLSQDFDWVKLHIENGKVTKEESNNQKALTQILNIDEGARYFGEVAFGLNNQITESSRMIILDEKMGKSLHMALGRCYDETPNGNDSSVHWDLIFNFIRAKAEVYFDGEKVFSKTKWIRPDLKFLN